MVGRDDGHAPSRCLAPKCMKQPQAGVELGCDFRKEREYTQENRQPESKHHLRINVWGRGFGSCGFVAAGRNASNFLALFLPRILAL